MIAIAARLPSCSESFWVDELHSAWSVWGTFGEVAPRAAEGNQTPFYFWVIWVWKQIFGESELILRLPSVIASSLAASVLVISIAQSRKCLLAGMVAGLLMALESNSIFYGTELRPFAFVILLGAIGSWALGQSFHGLSYQSKHATSLLVLISTIAFALQPTSIGVFVWLVSASFLIRNQSIRKVVFSFEAKPRLKFIYLFCLVLFSIQISGFGIEVLSTAWKLRTQWGSVGQATSFRQYWNAWPWVALVIAPSTIWMVARAVVAVQSSSQQATLSTADGSVAGHLVVVAALAVGTFWTVSVLDIAPVFHRRYFVACLPILAAACGEIVANTIRLVAIIRMPLTAMRTLTLTVATIPLAIVLVSQQLPAKMLAGDVVLVRRGEGWRQAVRWLHENQPADRVVLLSPGLIETERLLERESPSSMESAGYLTFPLSGTYPWKNIEVINMSNTKMAGGDTLVLRGSPTMGRKLIESQTKSGEIAAKIHTFGGVQVIEFSEVGAVDTK